MDIAREDREALIRDKYDGDASVDLSADLARLETGEPLAYVIGWIPFLGLRIELDSHPLIPRPETEWWTEQLIAHLIEKFGDTPFSFLDLCAGSGAIGLAVLARFPRAHVSFGELVPEHVEQIKKNIEVNSLDSSRATVMKSDLFEAFETDSFDVIATNPPYVPADRKLEESVSGFEPAVALYSGKDGLDVIRALATEVPSHIHKDGELWMECDISNIEKAQTLIPGSHIRTDQYGRPRVLVGYYPHE